jgi:hypothetical protein
MNIKPEHGDLVAKPCLPRIGRRKDPRSNILGWEVAISFHNLRPVAAGEYELWIAFGGNDDGHGMRLVPAEFRSDTRRPPDTV